jgi:hypothetical protein
MSLEDWFSSEDELTQPIAATGGNHDLQGLLKGVTFLPIPDRDGMHLRCTAGDENSGARKAFVGR